MQDISNKKFNTLKREVEKDNNKRKDISYSWIDRNTVIKIIML